MIPAVAVFEGAPRLMASNGFSASSLSMSNGGRMVKVT
jgi:hypothetical protein